MIVFVKELKVLLYETRFVHEYLYMYLITLFSILVKCSLTGLNFFTRI